VLVEYKELLLKVFGGLFLAFKDKNKLVSALE